MYSDDLLKRIKQYDNDAVRAESYKKSLLSAKPDFADAIEKWVYGEETDYEFKGISLKYIQEKEHCSYVKALLRMIILTENQELIPGYFSFRPVNKDW